jgi:hypothetical protein
MYESRKRSFTAEKKAPALQSDNIAAAPPSLSSSPTQKARSTTKSIKSDDTNEPPNQESGSRKRKRKTDTPASILTTNCGPKLTLKLAKRTHTGPSDSKQTHASSTQTVGDPVRDTPFAYDYSVRPYARFRSLIPSPPTTSKPDEPVTGTALQPDEPVTGAALEPPEPEPSRTNPKRATRSKKAPAKPKAKPTTKKKAAQAKQPTAVEAGPKPSRYAGRLTFLGLPMHDFGSRDSTMLFRQRFYQRGTYNDHDSFVGSACAAGFAHSLRDGVEQQHTMVDLD